MSDVALCIIATGKYTRYVEPLLVGVRKYFLTSHRVIPIVFTDNPENISTSGVILSRVTCGKWPEPALYRYRMLLTKERELATFDHIYYIDADMLIDDVVGDEILADGTVATQHPGWTGQSINSFTYERNPESKLYIPLDHGKEYFCGGFQGGAAKPFIEAMRWMRDAIDADVSNGITPRWLDESAWNKWCYDHEPAKILPTTYCSPDVMNVKGRKIVCISKDHAEARS